VVTSGFEEDLAKGDSAGRYAEATAREKALRVGAGAENARLIIGADTVQGLGVKSRDRTVGNEGLGSK